MSSEVIQQAQDKLPGVELELISQGAEALVFCTNKHPYLPNNYKPSLISNNNNKYIIKIRPSKPYRHPKLDRQINKSRTVSEAKLLHKLFTLNIKSPKLIAIDAPNGIIWMEYIGFNLPNGLISSLKNYLWFIEKENITNSEEVREILFKLGIELGLLHIEDIVHGDLTSSNIILTKDNNNKSIEPVLIDFGLSSYSNLIEDKAVDLYLLERALISTHPVYSKQYHEWILQGYFEIHKLNKGKNGINKYNEIIKRLEDVRLRGRKRSMLG